MRCKYGGISYHIDELFKMSLSLIAESLGSSGGFSHCAFTRMKWFRQPQSGPVLCTLRDCFSFKEIKVTIKIYF